MTTLYLPKRGRHHPGSLLSQRRASEVSVVETTEIRWFVTDALPADVRRWFMGPAPATEERCDQYLVDGRPDVGVKFRNGETLELKTRLETGSAVALTGGLTGAPELWRKWTLADGLVELSASQRWIAVDKQIVKRRFSLDGVEVESSPTQDGDPSCEVEIVAVRAAGQTAWSFAFAAHGPRYTRPTAIRAAWRTLMLAGAPTVRQMRLDRGRSMGYPEWLSRRRR